MKDKKVILGHAMACFTELMWGATFISSKYLLNWFTPVQLLTLRVFLAILVMFLVYPRRLRIHNLKREGIFALAGLTGIVMYFVLENTALTYTYAANVGVIVTCAPFFVALVVGIIFRSEKPGWNFFLGFVISMTGVIIISFIGSNEVGANPLGDMLAVLAMVSWGFYSALVKKIGEWNYHIIGVTRRIYLYAFAMLVPIALIQGKAFDPACFLIPQVTGNLLFLGVCASALGFIFWNLATRLIGAIKTSVYIYLSPVTTLILSVIVLHEELTLLSILGIALIFAGLILAQHNKASRPKDQIQDSDQHS